MCGIAKCVLEIGLRRENRIRRVTGGGVVRPGPGAVSGPRTGPAEAGQGAPGHAVPVACASRFLCFQYFADAVPWTGGDPPIRAGPPGKTAGRSRTPRAGILREPRPTEAQAPRPRDHAPRRTHAPGDEDAVTSADRASRRYRTNRRFKLSGRGWSLEVDGDTFGNRLVPRRSLFFSVAARSSTS